MEKSIIYKEKLILAGPCSAESEEQVLETARQLKENKSVDVFRAGIWKPRTNPGAFEGAGTKALPWLAAVKKAFNLPVATEVATNKHVEDALHFDIDVLWIGARTSVNPFSVQHIADALKGSNATVLIKNPINPDVKLWVGAVERLQKAGIENIGLIHRGFSAYGENAYRNAPIWQIPIKMKEIFPDLPLICDPSHIGGNSNLILDISQQSLDLGYQGLMIETHENPEVALTDKNQQITPQQLSEIMHQLVWKKIDSEKSSYQQQLQGFREKLDLFDNQVVELIGERMKIAQEIGLLKAKNKVTVLQSNRWNEIMERMLTKGNSLGLSSDFMTEFLHNIHVESIRIQQEKNQQIWELSK
jgi:chorismate mutase